MQVDAATAASMISGYRSNNGLPAVSVDPELMKLAEAQAQAMASRDKLDHNVIRGFNDRLMAQGYRARTAAENIGAGYHTLAEAFSGWRDSPPHRANMLLNGRNPHGHCRGLRAEIEIQGVLGADPRRARRAVSVRRLGKAARRSATRRKPIAVEFVTARVARRDVRPRQARATRSNSSPPVGPARLVEQRLHRGGKGVVRLGRQLDDLAALRLDRLSRILLFLARAARAGTRPRRSRRCAWRAADRPARRRTPCDGGRSAARCRSGW